jgi:uncharacterized protein YaaW (UPF0174 family)
MPKYRDSIESVIDRMNPDEKGMLKCVILYGSKLQGKTERIMDSPSELKTFGQDVTSDWVADKLDDIFSQGNGLRDALQGISRNYGKQLDKTIKDVIIKSLKVPRPMFSQDADSEAGAIQRERWITEKLMDSFIMSMDEDARRELAKQVDGLLKEKGVDVLKATQTSTALLTGGLSAARAILGAKFYILIAPLANLLARLAGPLSGTWVYFATGRFLWFLAGPIGWAITAVTALPLITSLINQRRYDKFIPAVFIIGLARIAQSNEQDSRVCI